MSKSYKKTPMCCCKTPSLKKIYNRRIRRKKYKYDISSHCYYKKMNDSWEIKDWISIYSWEEYWWHCNNSYSLWGFLYNPENLDRKEEYRKWYTRYKRK